MGTDFPGTLDHLKLSNGTEAHDLADMITSIDDTVKVLATYEADEWTGMNDVPAITVNTYGHGKAAYIGCRLGREGLAASLTELLDAIGLETLDAPESGGVLRVERSDNRGKHRFTFFFNRTHENVDITCNGEELVTSRAHGLGSGHSLTLEPNGVAVYKL